MLGFPEMVWKDDRLGLHHDALILGEPVVVEWTRLDGDKVRERMPALLAVDAVLNDARAGVEFQSGKVRFGKLLDVWGGSP